MFEPAEIPTEPVFPLKVVTTFFVSARVPLSVGRSTVIPDDEY